MAFLRFLAATAVALGLALPPVDFSASAGQLAYTIPRAVIAFREPQDDLTPRGISDQLAQDDVDTRLNVTIYNGQAGFLYAYITALDPINGDYHVLYHQGNDSYTWQVKPDGDSPVPVYFTLGDNNYQIELAPGQNTSLYLPSYAASGRIYIANGLLQFGTTTGGPDNGFVQPSVSNPGLQEYNTSYQFVEFTYLEGNFYTDISNVDFVSIPLGISVVSTTGLTTTVQGLVANATASICNALAQQTAKDYYNWAKLCVYLNGKLVRILSPTQYLTMYPYDNLSTYYGNYVNEVWAWYKMANLTIDTQDSEPSVENTTGANSSADTQGFVTCNTNNAADALICQQGSTQYAFPRPTTEQVFGCIQGAGSPFNILDENDEMLAKIVPRLCAAFQRSTLLLEGGEQQPNANVSAANYYQVKTTNHYARVVHEHEVEGMGYAFSYDDTNPVGPGLDNATANAAGLIKDSSPDLLYVVIGP